MYTGEDLRRAFRDIGIDPRGTLLVHSSVKALGEVDGGADTVLDALSGYMREGLLVLPAHTYEAYAGEADVFNPLTELPCVGLLPRMFFKRPGVVRSVHPSHSLCALGEDAVVFAAGEETADTPCPRNGCWGKLYDRNAQVLFMGAPLYTNTLIHAAEEWAGVPERIAVAGRPVTVNHPDGRTYTVSMHGHQSPHGAISMRYGKLGTPMQAMGVAVAGKIGDADCLLCDVRRMVDMTMGFLKKNPDLFADDEPVPEAYYHC